MGTYLFPVDVFVSAARLFVGDSCHHWKTNRCFHYIIETRVNLESQEIVYLESPMVAVMGSG